MEKSLAIIIAVTVPIAIVVFVGIVVCLIRRYLDKSRMGSVMYNRISHELDDEEVYTCCSFESFSPLLSRSSILFLSSHRRIHVL